MVGNRGASTELLLLPNARFALGASDFVVSATYFEPQKISGTKNCSLIGGLWYLPPLFRGGSLIASGVISS
jgi:hypothetical protein